MTLCCFPPRKRSLFLMYQLRSLNALNTRKRRNGRTLSWEQKAVFLIHLISPLQSLLKGHWYSLKCRTNWPEPSAWFHCGWPPSSEAEALLEGWRLSLGQLWLRFQPCLLLLGLCSSIEVVSVTALECHSKTQQTWTGFSNVGGHWMEKWVRGISPEFELF